MKKPKNGAIAWHDLTARNAEKLRDFYKTVVGWQFSGIDMGGYEDYVMMTSKPKDGVAGVCHKRGPNKDVPKGWMMYIQVKNFSQSLSSCKKKGGRQLGKTRSMGKMKFAYLKDPEGNTFAIVG